LHAEHRVHLVILNLHDRLFSGFPVTDFRGALEKMPRLATLLEDRGVTE